MFRTIFAHFALLAAGLLLARAADDALRVTVTLNPDGSKTVYRVDSAKHESIAITTTAGGKPGGRIVYKLDAEGRYESGQVFAANGTFRFKTLYRYNTAGQLAEESHLDKSDAVQHRIVYSFDPAGPPNGYVVYDGSGAVLGRTTPKNPGSSLGHR